MAGRARDTAWLERKLKGVVAQMLFLSCRAQSRHLLLLEILKMRDSSTPLGMTKEENPSVRCCRAFEQHALKS
jgi:hypothetical protein